MSIAFGLEDLVDGEQFPTFSPPRGDRSAGSMWRER
jgi:hypothetical protein